MMRARTTGSVVASVKKCVSGLSENAPERVNSFKAFTVLCGKFVHSYLWGEIIFARDERSLLLFSFH